LTERLALLIWAATPAHPELCVTPLVHALAARALDAEVEIHFAGPAVRWLVEGVANALYATPAKEKSIGDFLREVMAEDVRLLACGMARAAWVGDHEKLIPQAGAAGATAFVARTLDPAWRTLVF
jgi:predicted peroxiredoxin